MIISSGAYKYGGKYDTKSHESLRKIISPLLSLIMRWLCKMLHEKPQESPNSFWELFVWLIKITKQNKWKKSMIKVRYQILFKRRDSKIISTKKRDFKNNNNNMRDLFF